MKRIDILLNHFDDGLLYVDGVPWNDIGWREANSIMLLKEPLKEVVEVNIRKTNLVREDYPNFYEEIFDYQI